MAVGQKTGGRTKGTPNKATADIKALAREHAPDAMRELARLATKAESEAARVAAIKELFDRGFGKPTQSLDLSNPDGTLAPAPSIIQIVGVTAQDDNGAGQSTH
jgi:hypothetical protein